MLKVQLTILFIILGVIGLIFFLTQQSSLAKLGKTSEEDPLFGLLSDKISPIPTPTGGQPQQPAQNAQMGPEKEFVFTVIATIKTSKGNIEAKLYKDQAKAAVNNFAGKAQAGFYNNLTFHRVEDWVIQGGDPLGTGTGGNAFQSELNGLPFEAGSLGFAASDAMQSAPDQGIRISNDSQFFITKSAASWLDPTYTNFGIVTNGMDVVNKIQKGDKILSVTITEREEPTPTATPEEEKEEPTGEPTTSP